MKLITGIPFVTFLFSIIKSQQANRILGASFIERAPFLQASKIIGNRTNNPPIMKKLGACFRLSI